MVFLSVLCAVLSPILLVPAYSQQNFFGTNVALGYYDNLFAPSSGRLSSLSNDSFTTIQHPAHPQYAVRVKKSSFCDGAAAAYTGYIDVQARHLFFYFFESRSNPDKDDVVLWTNGGPGGSSAIGLFMELGPCRIVDKDGPQYFDESWNSNANIFFIDQPVGTGFSYADSGETVSTSEQGAVDIIAFVSIFFEHFHQFKGRRFHLAGESYAGRHLPVYASAIYDANHHLAQKNLSPINLTSVMIGNGLTDYRTMLSAYYEFTCTRRAHLPVLDISTCVRMKSALPRCEKWVKASCVDTFDGINCQAANDFCIRELGEPYFAAKLNQHDITKQCANPEDICYPEVRYIEEYLSNPLVQTQLGVDSPGQNFTAVNLGIQSAFLASLDWYSPTTTLHVAALLERGVKVLIYVGANDWVCNYIGNERWIEELEWTGSADFARNRGGERNWYVEHNGQKQIAGRTRKSHGLTFATIDGAGHMAPYDKPKEALELANRWLKGLEL